MKNLTRHANLTRQLWEAEDVLGDLEAEAASESALFGDSGPGSDVHNSELRAVVRDLRAEVEVARQAALADAVASYDARVLEEGDDFDAYGYALPSALAGTEAARAIVVDLDPRHFDEPVVAGAASDDIPF